MVAFTFPEFESVCAGFSTDFGRAVRGWLQFLALNLNSQGIAWTSVHLYTHKNKSFHPENNWVIENLYALDSDCCRDPHFNSSAGNLFLPPEFHHLSMRVSGRFGRDLDLEKFVWFFDFALNGPSVSAYTIQEKSQTHQTRVVKAQAILACQVVDRSATVHPFRFQAVKS